MKQYNGIIYKCKDCKHWINNIEGCEILSGVICYPDDSRDIYKNFKPKEKPMENKVIFESEEEFENKFSFGKIFALVNKKWNKDEKSVNQQCFLTYEVIKQLFKEEGYIRKSVVDEAEEMYQDKFVNHDILSRELIYKQHEAIQELKNELQKKS